MHQTYAFAKKFLLEELNHPDAEIILESYLEAPDRSNKPEPLSIVFRGLLVSAQNANMKSNVIGGAISGIDNIGRVLFDFKPLAVKNTFGTNDAELLDQIINKLAPKGKVRRGHRSLWPKYCKTVLGAAAFLAQFKDGKEFYDWANHFYCDERSRLALPLLLSEEIPGIGFALACDFLKDLGFVRYGKPDTHVRDIFTGIGLSLVTASDYQIQKQIREVANAAGISAFNVDKLFWHIGSGKFENHKFLGRTGEIGSKKEKFISKFILARPNYEFYSPKHIA